MEAPILPQTLAAVLIPATAAERAAAFAHPSSGPYREIATGVRQDGVK